MKTKYSKHMKKLWKLTGKIGNHAELSLSKRHREAYGKVYAKLSEALDEAERTKLIRYTPETKEEWD